MLDGSGTGCEVVHRRLFAAPGAPDSVERLVEREGPDLVVVATSTYAVAVRLVSNRMRERWVNVLPASRPVLSGLLSAALARRGRAAPRSPRGSGASAGGWPERDRRWRRGRCWKATTNACGSLPATRMFGPLSLGVPGSRVRSRGSIRGSRWCWRTCRCGCGSPRCATGLTGWTTKSCWGWDGETPLLSPGWHAHG